MADTVSPQRVLHPKKRVEIVVEKMRAPEVIALATRLGATGYTVLPCIAGSGHTGLRGASDVVEVFDNVLVVIITSPATADRLMDEVLLELEDCSGIISVADVLVARAEHF